jgi:DNA ligase (NAD+)
MRPPPQHRVDALRAQIAEHNRRYYQEAAPTITDREYDALYRELADLEAAHPELARADSPTQRRPAGGVHANPPSGADAQPG